MLKGEVKNLADYFGSQLPAGKIADREVRIAIVRLYASLSMAAKPVDDEIGAVRKGLVSGIEDKMGEWASLNARAADKSLTEAERGKAKADAEAMTECVKANADFVDAVERILAEPVTAEISKVRLEVLYEALCDCNFPSFAPDMPIAAAEQIFQEVILK